jgi:hypothetical protein
VATLGWFPIPYSSEEGDVAIGEWLWMQDPVSTRTKFLNLYQEAACVSVYLEIMFKKKALIAWLLIQFAWSREPFL